MTKLRVALVFGGRSAEHDVSLTSAVGILKNIHRDRYDILPIKISREGRWQLLPADADLDSPETLDRASGPVLTAGDPTLRGFYRIGNGTDPQAQGPVPVDVVFPVLHGTFGEDGTVQGLLGLSDLPCVGAGVMASALGMDKVLMKQVFLQNELPCVDFIWFLRKRWKTDAPVISKAVAKEIGFPCFIKPANSGSSVGVNKAKDAADLVRYIEAAAEFDRKILIEKAVDGRELECAVLGNDEPLASVVGEILPVNEFYDYSAKYELDSKTVVPVELSEPIARAIREFAKEAFKAVDCAGMARVDFLLERGTNRIFVNEINTIPGFTPISMYSKMWEASGVPYADLIDRLIELALERHADVSSSRFHRAMDADSAAGGAPRLVSKPLSNYPERN
jgi:D-alanine-D-alanine ligase